MTIIFKRDGTGLSVQQAPGCYPASLMALVQSFVAGHMQEGMLLVHIQH